MCVVAKKRTQKLNCWRSVLINNVNTSESFLMSWYKPLLLYVLMFNGSKRRWGIISSFYFSSLVSEVNIVDIFYHNHLSASTSLSILSSAQLYKCNFFHWFYWLTHKGWVGEIFFWTFFLGNKNMGKKWEGEGQFVCEIKLNFTSICDFFISLSLSLFHFSFSLKT